MDNPCIISVAITGSVPRKKDNPALPVSTAEQIESTHAAFEAGASLVHVHVRDEQENPSSDPARFEAVLTGVRKHCPGMIIQFSSSGHKLSTEPSSATMKLGPDMVSFTTGTTNFRTRIYENPPEFVRRFAAVIRDAAVKPEIEVFDLAMLYSAAELVEDGLLPTPLHVQFVFGVRNALPARRSILEFQIAELQSVLPGATWTAAGVGRHQIEVNHWALELGGHCRTGLEDNMRFDKEHLAESNAQLVARVAGLCGQYDRRPATPAEARTLLSLPQAA